MYKVKEILKGELIGVNTEVAYAKNKANINLKGKIVDETKNTITIQTKDNKRKMLQKDQVVLKVEKHKRMFLIDGALLKGRPEDRIKVKNKW